VEHSNYIQKCVQERAEWMAQW